MVESNNHEDVGFAVVEAESGRAPGPLYQEVDRRRRAVRTSSERLVEGAAWLLPSDRALVIAVYRDGVRPADVASAAGIGVRVVRRRLRRLCSRVLSERFWFVVGARDAWSPVCRRVATACVLQGRSKREAARFLQVTLHRVRAELEVVEAHFAARRGVRERAA
jgi:DNA-directed RNA polymerase specialized sigma24 family protein